VRFIDTSYLVALRLCRDENHAAAVRLWTPARRSSRRTMRRERLQEALAFDGDFAAAGFIEVRPV